MASIAVEHLSKRYPSGTLALSDVNLEVGEGEFVAVVGPSGCGKSTLLRIMAALDTPTEGCVTVERGAAAEQALPSAVVFQEASLFPWMRVAENVAFAFGQRLRMPKSEVQRRGRKGACAGRAERLRRGLPARALRRDVAARGGCARLRRRSAGALHGRAVRRARRANARRAGR